MVLCPSGREMIQIAAIGTVSPSGVGQFAEQRDAVNFPSMTGSRPCISKPASSSIRQIRLLATTPAHARDSYPVPAANEKAPPVRAFRGEPTFFRPVPLCAQTFGLFLFPKRHNQPNFFRSRFPRRFRYAHCRHGFRGSRFRRFTPRMFRQPCGQFG